MKAGNSGGALITVFGGSGFLGSHVVGVLARAGYRVRVAVRRPDLAGYLQPLGEVGQITGIQANLRYRWSIDRAVDGADGVVNCVGIMNPSGRQTFDAVQAFGPRAIADAARLAGISNLVHVSAIGADAASDIDYMRTKGEGEAAVSELVPDAVIMRPSIIFGPEDDFFNRFADLARFAPALPLIGGETRFQPVYVGDVAAAIGEAINGNAEAGAPYELGGPDVASLRTLMETMMAVTERHRPLLSVPFEIAQPLGRLLSILPKPPFTADQVRMLRHDNIVSDGALAEGRTLAGLGLSPKAMAVILPTYLARYREHGQFAHTRTS